MDGTVKEVEHGYELRFERELAHPIEKVWDALTKPERLADWFAEGPGSVMELRIGGRVHLDGHDGIESTVTALDPPHLLEFGWKTAKWDGGPIRFELSPTDGGGTHLVFTHMHPPLDYVAEIDVPEEVRGTDPTARTLAGWHTILDQLVTALDGKSTGFSMDTWRSHYDRYAEKVTTGS